MNTNKNKKLEQEKLDRPDSTPVFIYELASDEAELIRTSAPISPGDYVSFKLSDGTFIERKRVKSVHHLEHTVQIRTGYLSSQIELEE
jgi:hypothetical protein